MSMLDKTPKDLTVKEGLVLNVAVFAAIAGGIAAFNTALSVKERLQARRARKHNDTPES